MREAREGKRGERGEVEEREKEQNVLSRQRKDKAGEGRKGREWGQGILLASIPGSGKPSPEAEAGRSLPLVQDLPVYPHDCWHAQLTGQLPTGNSQDKAFHSEASKTSIYLNIFS